MSQPARPASITVYEVEERHLDSDTDLEYVDEVAADVAAALHAGQPIEANYQPGDGTRYKLVFVPLRGLATARQRVKDGRPWGAHAVDGMANTERAGDLASDFYEANGYLVASVEGGCYPIRLGDRGVLAADYIDEHWKIGSAASSVSLAVLLRAISHYLDQLAEPATLEAV